jgi:hypothetical protein
VKIQNLIPSNLRFKFKKRIEPTVLYPHKINVNELNSKKLKELKGELKTFKAKDTGM